MKGDGAIGGFWWIVIILVVVLLAFILFLVFYPDFLTKMVGGLKNVFGSGSSPGQLV